MNGKPGASFSYLRLFPHLLVKIQKFFFVHVLTKDVLLLRLWPMRNKLEVHSI